MKHKVLVNNNYAAVLKERKSKTVLQIDATLGI